MRSRRDVEDDRFYYEPSDADRARFFVDVPYFYENAFDPTSGGQMKPDSFDERGYYKGGKFREDADETLNAYMDFINLLDPENDIQDTPKHMAFIQDFVDEKVKGMHPYNYYRASILDKLKDLPLSELAQMTRRGYTPHRELMRDMASITPNPRTYHGFDAQEMFLPNKNIPLKNIPDSIRPIIEGKGKIPELMLRNADAKTKRGFRDRGKRLASLEAAIEANRRASSIDNANLNVRENAIQSFLPSIPAPFGPRPYSKNIHRNVPYARTSFYDYGAKPLHTFDEDDEASAVVMNEAFPEQWQLINRSEDSFETAWNFLSTLNKEFVDDDWTLLKMPFYHGTTSKYDGSIKEEGLDPANNLSALEQHTLDDLYSWLEEHGFDYDDFDPDKDWTWVSLDNPLATMAYAMAANNNAGVRRFSPIVYEIDDDIDVVEDVMNDGEFRGAYRTDEVIPPKKIREYFRFRPMNNEESYSEYREKVREALKQRAGES